MKEFIQELGIQKINSGVCEKDRWVKKPGGKPLVSLTPIDGSEIAAVLQGSTQDYEKVVTQAEEVFLCWRMLPAPQRGEFVRRIGNQLRDKKALLGRLVSLEMGK